MTANIVTFETPIDPQDFQKRVALEGAQPVSLNLSCLKCDQLYKNPKILPCMHYFCQSCIENTMVRNNQLDCYLCHEEIPYTVKINELMTHYPMIDLIQLKKLRDEISRNPKQVYCVNCSFGKNNTAAERYCCDCKEIMCRHDSTAHDRYKPTHRSVTIDELMKEEHMEKLLSDFATVKCSRHPKQEIKYYCVECEEQICDDCGFGDHNTHKKTFLKAALNLFCDSVDQKMDELGKPGIAMLEEADKYDDQVRQLVAKQKTTIDRITKHFCELVKVLEIRRDTLILNINSWYSALRDQLYTACEKQGTLLKKISTLADFVTNYREYPNNYKIELTSMITKRFASLKASIPKIPLQVKAVEYDKGIESEVDSQLDNIGWLKYLHKTLLDTPIKHFGRSDLVPFSVDNKEPEANTIDLQAIAEGYNNRLYVFSSHYSNGEAKGNYDKDTCQVFDSQFNIIETITCPSILQKPTQILIGRGQDNLIYILERDHKNIIIRDENFKRTVRCISADDINSIQDPSSIALTSRSNLVVYDRSMNELIILDKDFMIEKRISIKPLSIKRRDSPSSSTHQKSATKAKKPVEKEPKTPEPSQSTISGSITIAINSRDHIFICSEEKALITVYNLEGKEVCDLNFQDRLKLLEDHTIHEHKAVVPELESNVKEKPLTRKTTTTSIGISKPAPSTPHKRSPTPKSGSKPETVTHVVLQPTTKTFLAIDSLDNIYVIQKNWIIMFDPQYRFSGASKLGFEPVSLIVNKSGYVYVMSDKGEINVYN